MFELNYWAILVAALAAMVIGGMWYGPLFGKVWMRLTGISQEKIDEIKKKGMAKSYILNFVGYLVMAYVLAHIISYTNATTWQSGIQGGFWMWLGFVATTGANEYIYAVKPKPWTLYFINQGNILVTLMVMGAILARWV